MDVFQVFNLIDLNYPGLEEVKDTVLEGNKEKALELYLEFIRKRKDRTLYLEEDIEAVVTYCDENYKEDFKEIIDTAEEVKNNTFTFRFTWDMERTNKPFTFEKEIQWDRIPFEDEEWVFMLNRHRYWIALGQAYALTKDDCYAETFFKQLEHWIDNNPLKEENYKSTWRTIEAGIRCENWVKAFMYFKSSKSLNPALLSKFIISLNDHGNYIYESYDNFRRLSNWGVLESHGLFILSIFLPELLTSDKYRSQSLHRLKEQINLQVMRDGMHWEQSPMYQNEVLHCYLDTIILAEKNHIALHKEILDKTKALAYADLYMSKPNHHQPMQSDSDDTDLRDMLTKAAYIFQDGILKFGAYGFIDFESLWDLGIEAIESYEKIKAMEPKHSSYAFEDSGNYYMRSGWKEEDNYMYFHCGTLGSGHGHADLLHFDIHAKGESILIDPGRYTYIEGNEIRNYLKSCKAHNTTLVDNIDFTTIEGSWKVSKAAWPMKQSFISHEEYNYVEGGHLGYIELPQGVFVNRKIIFVKPNYWVIVDEFYGNGKHNYTQYFHFDKGSLSLKKDYTEFQGNKARLKLFTVKDNIKREIKKDYVSKEYT